MIDVEKIPNAPGVYIFRDNQGNIIYVGKAKNLKDRLRAYLELSDTRPSVPKILLKSNTVDWIVTASESEALSLEESLIKKHKPKYNVKLKDSKTYPSIRLSIHEEYPSLHIIRRPKRDDSLYFGPYFNSASIRTVFSAVKNAFGIRTCTNSKFLEFKRIGRPCLDGQIDICLSPCVKKQRSKYMENVWLCIDFLRGNFEPTLKMLEKRMWDASRNENFEEAAKIRDAISILKKTVLSHRIVFDELYNFDFVAMERGFSKIGVFVLKVRNGRLIGGDESVFEDISDEVEPNEFFETFINTYYKNNLDLPEKVFSDLSPTFSYNVEIQAPKSKAEIELFQMAKRNALEAILKRRDVNSEGLRNIEKLKDFFRLDVLPRKLEVFDFSNLFGSNPSGAKVRFDDGVINKNLFRRYRISDEAGSDDHKALSEVLERRIKAYNEGREDLPDAFLIDGGKGHLTTAKSVLEKFGVNVPVICIAKKRDIKGKRHPRDVIF